MLMMIIVIVEWKYNAKMGRVVAGENREGNHLNQLNWFASLFVDEDYSLYVSRILEIIV
jgi:hypothetical protein